MFTCFKRLVAQGLRAAGAASLCLLWSAAATAQQVIEFGDLEALKAAMGADTPAPVEALKEGAEKEDKSAESSPRLKRLKKLVFDRRPSAILDAWSKPLEPKPELPPKPKQDSEDAGDTKAEDAAEPVTDAAAEEEPVTADSHGEAADGSESATAEVASDVDEETAAVDAASESDDGKDQKAAQKERKAAEKKAKAEYEKAEKKLLEWEMKYFQRLVTLGDWAGVEAYFEEVEDFEAKGAYEKLLASLLKGPVKVKGPLAPYAEKNFFAPEDLTGLVAAAPTELEDDALDQLAKLLRLCVDEGNLLELCLTAFRAALTAEDYPIEPAQFARMLIEAKFPVEAGEFLPEPEVAIAENQRHVLNLLARHYLAVFEEEKKTEHLEHAWDSTRAVLADGEVEDDDKEEALKRAVAIAPDVRDELGQAWLAESFTKRPERGMEILRVIGAGTSKGLFDRAKDASQRLESLQLQTTAAEALLAAAPELAAEWRDTMTLLANNWLQEAVHSYKHDQSTSRGPSVNRDVFGNVYYRGLSGNSASSKIPAALRTDEVLEIRPSAVWLELVTDGLRPKFAMVTAQLLLKVNEETEAFPYIERMARVHSDQALELVHEFLRVWTRNNNPNSVRQRTSQFMFIYGFDARAGGIPLTRSKQERNLTALAGWVQRIRKLGLEGLDEELIATAFTSAHSKAEVFQLETIERVFGEMDRLKPETLAVLVQKMRTNLADVWRNPSVQKENQTQRRQKDIQAEVLRGYEVARQVATQALASHPQAWELMHAKAAVAHDENNYLHEIAKSPEFSDRRRMALADFKRAAELYEAQAGEMKLDEETVELYQTWFYASLGACDLKMLDHEKLPAADQYPLIRASMERLPGEAAERALASFANSLYTRMSNVSPAVKFRYVRAGLEIVGDHARAREAREVADYYGDLVTEIKLETSIDGSDHVGHDQPFGMFVNIRHTGAIEREAGGFSKYLVNQTRNPYGFNYGRPPEDYRDKFEEATREALSDDFEVLSVTFNHPDTHSRATHEYGWRITPYVYILMQARGPEIDRVPALRLDLDFVDTTGYAVLPAQSAPLAIVATGSQPVERPFAELKVTQTLDERQAKDGKLLLEVKATALGLVPEVESFLALAPKGFVVDNTEDQGVSVVNFDQEVDGIAVLTERIWMVAMSAEKHLETLPVTFDFGSDLSKEAQMEYLRFADADLDTVGASISLEESYGTADTGDFWLWIIGMTALVAGLARAIFLLRRKPANDPGTARFRMPETVSPFTVIGLLRDIQSHNGVSASARAELTDHIEHIEGHFFDERASESPDLEAIAQRWASRY